jgi:hypothetical protein
MGLSSDRRLAAATMGVLRGVPQLALYSVRAPLSVLGALAAPYVVLWTLFGLSTVTLAFAFLTAMLLCCLVFCVLQVAMCYEINEAFEGTRPVPISGLCVALAGPKRVALVAVLGIVSVYFQRWLSTFGRIDRVLGAAGPRSYEVASLLAVPLIATTEHPVGRTLEAVLQSVEERWERGLALAVGTKATGMALTWGGILLAVVLFAAAVFGRSPSLPLLGPFTLPLLVAVGGFVPGTAAHLLVPTVLETALFRSVCDGEFPTGTDAERVIETPESAGTGVGGS